MPQPGIYVYVFTTGYKVENEENSEMKEIFSGLHCCFIRVRRLSCSFLVL